METEDEKVEFIDFSFNRQWKWQGDLSVLQYASVFNVFGCLNVYIVYIFFSFLISSSSVIFSFKMNKKINKNKKKNKKK